MNWFNRFFKKKSGDVEMCGLQPADNPPPMPPVKPPKAEISVDQVWTMQSEREVFFAEVIAIKDGWVQYKMTVVRNTPFSTGTAACITDRTVESFVGIYKLLRD